MRELETEKGVILISSRSRVLNFKELGYIPEKGITMTIVNCTAGTRTSRDIGLFHLSYGGVYTCARTIAAITARSSYGKDAPNCDISMDSDGRRVHVMFG
jgi:hypothetical protein